MKITKIALYDFRAFIHDVEFIIPEGRNVLLYGENGSGKSSLFHALREFFGAGPQPTRPYQNFCNVFKNGAGNPLGTDGYVRLDIAQPHVPTTTISWDCGSPRPSHNGALAGGDRQLIQDAASRSSFLDYRSLLRTNFDLKSPQERLFSLAVEMLLHNTPVLNSTVGWLWRGVLGSVSGNHTKNAQQRLATALNSFNSGVQGILPDVVTLATVYLNYFAHAGLELSATLPSVAYHAQGPRKERALYNRTEYGRRSLVLDFEVRLNGVVLPEWTEFLNEARLSALAMSLYLAGVKLSNASAPNDPTKLRLLVLDDLLLGLDLSNRLPVIRILEEHFSDYQIFLFTHDKVWYEMAQLAFAESKNWALFEMQRSTQVDFDVPAIYPHGTGTADYFLTKAKSFLDAAPQDLRAAAFYARVAFEVKLKRYCAKYKVQVPYDLDGRQLKTTDFLDAIERRLSWNGKSAKALFLIQKVKLYLGSVLNPLSHYHPVTLDPDEVRRAVVAVKELNFDDKNTDYFKLAHELLQRPSLTQQELIDSACHLRTAFEVELRGLLKKCGGMVAYRDNWTLLNLDELWNAAQTCMTNTNAVAAGLLIANIKLHQAVFLNTPWTYGHCLGLHQPVLATACAALHDPAHHPVKSRIATFA